MQRIFGCTQKQNPTILILIFVVVFLSYRKYRDISCLIYLEENEFETTNGISNNSPKNSIEEDNAVDKVVKDTHQSRKLSFRDIFFTIKTTKNNLKTRIKILLDTWIPKVKSQTFIITDELDEYATTLKGVNFVATKCGSDHNKKDLSCKTVAEYQTFRHHQKKNSKKWWCHLDDDMYLNPIRLAALLSQYDWREWYYIGRLSIPRRFKAIYQKKTYNFIFVTGAVYCISQSLAEEMTPWMTEKVFLKMSAEIGRNDDCTVGFIINGMLNVSITEPVAFHTHLENQSFLDGDRLKYDAAFSYGKNGNTVSFGDTKPLFTAKEDPTRFYSLHCLLFPKQSLCENKKIPA